MRITRSTRLMLWISAAALLLTVGLVWKKWQDRVNPLVHGQRLNYWVEELDRFPANGEPWISSAPATPLAADYLRSVPRLAPARIAAFLRTRNSTTKQMHDWCEQHLPKPVLAFLPHPWVCQAPRRVVSVLSNSAFGPDPELRAELESLARNSDPRLHEPAYRALFQTGWYPRGYYTNLLDAAPLLAAGLQLPSSSVHQVVFEVLGELSTQHRLSEWPASLPSLITLIEPFAQNRGDLSVRFVADGLLRDLGVKRPTTVAVSQSTTINTSSEPSRLFKAVDWPSLNSSSLVLPAAAYVPGGKMSEGDFGKSINAAPTLRLRE